MEIAIGCEMMLENFESPLNEAILGVYPFESEEIRKASSLITFEAGGCLAHVLSPEVMFAERL